MKSKTKIIENSSILWWIYGGSASVTLYFNAKIQDPFNSPKLWLLLFISSWVLGHIISNSKEFSANKSIKIYLLIIVLFITLQLISAFKTDNLYRAFLGENQRRNGVITYFSLAIFSLAAAIYVRKESFERFIRVALFTGISLAAYGLLQINGKDFVQWNNPYNAIISTVGNPNFAAAIMAVIGIILFGPVLNNTYKKYFRVVCGVVSLFLLYIIYLSDARQGLISFALGVGVYTVIYFFHIKHKLRHIVLVFGISVASLSVLAMLQIGPLTSYLYKGSVTVRGYYWRAGIEMFKNNPFFGIGVERYGAYFKEYREVDYPLNYGFVITSSNAHNVPIQMFATAGVFVGIAYLLLLVFIALVGIKGIRKAQGNEKLKVASVFAAWIGYQAQSIISIDNIGISVWGWVLGGMLVGLSIKNEISLDKQFKNSGKVIFNFKQTISSTILVVLSLILIVPSYQGEKNMFETRARFNPEIETNRSALYESAKKTLNTPFLDPNFKFITGSYLVASGYIDEGMKVLDESIKEDPRNLDALLTLSQFNEQMGNLDKANMYRRQIAKYDPWNASNYLQLGRNFKALGDFSQMSLMREKINSFASKTQEAIQANSELI
jgi:O-antigen ligase